MGKTWWIRAALPLALSIAAVILAFAVIDQVRAQRGPPTGKPSVVEYYYKTKWGHADEFITLFKKSCSRRKWRWAEC
jgi:hypothetical protein